MENVELLKMSLLMHLGFPNLALHAKNYMVNFKFDTTPFSQKKLSVSEACFCILFKVVPYTSNFPNFLTKAPFYKIVLRRHPFTKFHVTGVPGLQKFSKRFLTWSNKTDKSSFCWNSAQRKENVFNSLTANLHAVLPTRCFSGVFKLCCSDG